MKDNRYLYNRQYFKSSKDFQSNKERLEKLVNKIKEYNPRMVLDVGCGMGYLVTRLNEEGIVAMGSDFSPDLRKNFWGDRECFVEGDARKLPFADKEFDLVVSTDFFEHIDEEDIDLVANEMKRVGDTVITFVADNIGGNLNKRQLQYHVTYKDMDWWKTKLKGIEGFSSHTL